MEYKAECTCKQIVVEEYSSPSDFKFKSKRRCFKKFRNGPNSFRVGPETVPGKVMKEVLNRQMRL